VAKKKTKRKTTPTPPSRQQAFEELDRVFHERARLGILTAVIGSVDGLNFNELKDVCGLTDGNLNRHVKVLLDAKVLKVMKTGSGQKTNSAYSLTASGRKAFEKYLDALEMIVQTAQSSSRQPASTRVTLAPE